MIHSLLWAALGTGFTFLMTALGAATVFFLRGEQPLQKPMCGFAAGVMTAASVWSLLLPAIEQAKSFSLPAWLPAAAGILFGTLFLSALDALLPHLQRRLQDESARQSALLTWAITLHNIPEGMAVGLAFALAWESGELPAAITLALGIGIQNFPEGAAIALPLRQMGRSYLRAFAIGTLSGVVEPLFGILVVLAASEVQALMPWALSFAAGAMLYVVVEELVPQAQGKSGTASFIVGFLIMMILDVALG